ncbi:hypothetical protein EV193_10129 [Herbihabitans rhizosphaerae]|uniref:Uncharacterized protein n=1 Tax=Herbihabitans rhizosphaerae TaxID=1872711 RepID=A0A4Q7L4F3_9PSEU|nr:hypothetical protein [Herbihabitans rhizosphaerae]RZS44155.1 hypothetical protein EV193_10129 [Herbihabitans rhizosphaerae]
MPIRTNRGRAAVYRRLWGWPMRSPRHLVITVFLLAVIVTAIGIMLPKLLDSGSNQPAAGTPTGAGQPSSTQAQGTQPGATTPGATSPLPTRLPPPQPQLVTAPTDPQALEIATKWAQAWVTHPQGITNAQWVAALRPYMLEEQLGPMSKVEPANVPATALTGPAVVKSSYTTEMRLEQPTDGGVIAIDLIKTPQGWRVGHYDKVS